MKDLNKLEERIGTKFEDKELFLQSLTHRSYLNEHPDFKLDHNERLEFLGDAVLELVVTEHLYRNYPNPEGELTNWRASLVNGVTLAEIGKELGIEDNLLMSKGESQDKNSKARMYILANAMEAIIGAIYLDQGFAAAKGFIDRFILSRFEEILEKKLYLDPKSSFQEKAQEKLGITPNYRVISSVGPDPAKTFTIGVYLGDDLVETGTGTSKQEAQTDAAKKALNKKKWNN